MILSGNAKDLTGQRFGYLIAQEPVGEKNGHIVWHCKCDCGGAANAMSSVLIKGRKKSCGCQARNKTGKSGGKQSLCMSCRNLCEWLLSFPASVPGTVEHFESQGLKITEVKKANQLAFVVTDCPWFKK